MTPLEHARAHAEAIAADGSHPKYADEHIPLIGWSLLSIAESLDAMLDEGVIDVNVAQYDGDHRVR